MSAIQLNFTLRTSPHCQTVHLLGSWDNYAGQLPLHKSTASTDKPGSWKGAFRFQAPATLQPGQRYWYYYIIDGYHVSHDPARDAVVEPTTGRKLNVLDIPASSGDAAAKPSAKSSRQARRSTAAAAVATGRALPASAIQHPKPTKPHQTLPITTESFSGASVDELSRRFAAAKVAAPSVASDSEEDSDSDDDDDDDDDSDAASDVPSLSSSRSTASTRSSVSSCCTCERYGITRAGSRVRLDCGGSRCAGSSDEGSSSCSEESSDDEHEAQNARAAQIKLRRPAAAASKGAPAAATRRHGMVVRR